MENIRGFKQLSKPLILLMAMYSINTFITGSIIYYLTDFDIITSLFSSVSGSITDITIIGTFLGADTAIVGLMQTSRVIFTLAFFPPWIAYLSKDIEDAEKISVVDLNPSIQDVKDNNKKLAFTIIVSLIASYIGSLFSFPASTLIMSTAVITVLNIYTEKIYINNSLKTVVQVLAGAYIGASISRQTILGIPKLIIPILILISSYFIINYIYSVICPKLGWLDKKTSHFAASPAGASDMALIAADMGVDLSDIGTIQIARLIYSVTIMPQLIILFLSFVIK